MLEILNDQTMIFTSLLLAERILCKSILMKNQRFPNKLLHIANNCIPQQKSTLNIKRGIN